MKKIMLIILAAALPLWPALAGAQKSYDIKMAHTGTEQSMMHLGYLFMKDYIEKNSNGAVKVRIFSGGQLGNDTEMVEMVQNGDLQLIGINNGYLSQFHPAVGVFALPFVFKTKAIAYQVLDGPFGRMMLDSLEPACGVKALAYIDSFDYRQYTGNKPVKTPADLRGIKIRVMPNPVHLAIWEALGANPSPIPFSELYTALQQKTVDAQENPMENIVTARLYEVQKYVVLTNHVFTSGMTLVNPEFYNSLPPELQKVLREAALECNKYQRAEGQRRLNEFFETVKNGGVEIITLSPEDLKAFEEAAKPVVPTIAKEVGQDQVDGLYKAVAEAEAELAGK
jgi:tripartite ATP-independent transporter DctP family solute receptor